MIKVHYILIPFILALLAACSEQVPDRAFSLKDESVSFSREGGTGEISFVSNRNWQATTDAQWCRVFPSSGSALFLKDHSMLVQCDQNMGDDRSCAITIESEGQTITVIVSQSHASLVTDCLDYSISFHAQLLPVPFRAEGTFDIETDDRCSGWMRIASTKAPLSKDTVWIAVSENRAGVREGLIYVSCNGKTDAVRIQQDAQVVPLADEGLKKKLLSLGCDRDRDGLITVAEAEILTKLDCSSFNLTSTEGLEYFPNITELSIVTSVLHEFDFSLFEKLETVKFRGPIESADLSKNSLMKSVTLMYTQCGTICLKNLKRLEKLSLQGEIGDLDYDGCDNLRTLQIGYNEQSSLCLPPTTSITKLNVHHAPNLTKLDVSALPSVTEVIIDHMPLIVTLEVQPVSNVTLVVTAHSKESMSVISRNTQGSKEIQGS